MKKISHKLALTLLASSFIPMIGFGMDNTRELDTLKHVQKLHYNSDGPFDKTISYLIEMAEAQKEFEKTQEDYKKKSEISENLNKITKKKLKESLLLSSEEAKDAAYDYAAKKDRGYCRTPSFTYTLKEADKYMQAQKLEQNKKYGIEYELTFDGKTYIGLGHHLFFYAMKDWKDSKREKYRALLPKLEKNVRNREKEWETIKKDFVSSYALLTIDNMRQIDEIAKLYGIKIAK